MPEATRIRDLPASEKPRERPLAKGADALRESELIAILLRTGTQGLSAIDVAQSLLTKFGSLEALVKAPVDELRVKSVGRNKAITLKAAFSLAKRRPPSRPSANYRLPSRPNDHMSAAAAGSGIFSLPRPSGKYLLTRSCSSL